MCLAGRERRGLPELRLEFASAAVLNNNDTTKARAAAYLFLALVDRLNDFIRINVIKSYYVELAQQLFALGVLAIVASYIVGAYAPPKPTKPNVVHCTVTGKTVLVSKTLDCTIVNGGNP